MACTYTYEGKDYTKEELSALLHESKDLLQLPKETKVEPIKTNQVIHNEKTYFKNENGNWVNSDTGNEIKGIGAKGKELIANLDHSLRVKQAIEQIDKGILQWNGDINTPRIDLGMSWADIRKGESDLRKGKTDSVPAKRLLEAFEKAKKEGGYHYKMGTGGKNMRSGEFVSFEDMQRSVNENNLTDAELEEINRNQDKLSEEYKEYFNSLTEKEQNEILENYEGKPIEPTEVKQNTEDGVSKNDVSNQEEPTEKETSIKNAVVEAEREEKGKKPIEKLGGYNEEKNFNETKEKVDKGEISPRDLAIAIIENPNGVPITHEVSDALAYDRMRLDNEYEQALKEAEKDPTDVSVKLRIERLEKEIENNDKASSYSGTISSYALLARKKIIKQDYSISRLILKYKAKNNGEISEEKRAEFAEISKRLQEAEEKLAKYEAESYDRNSQKEFEKLKVQANKEKRLAKKQDLKEERQNLYEELKKIRREQMSRLSANPIPVEMIPTITKLAKNLILDGIVTLDGVVENIHENLKDIVDGVTERDIRDALSGYGIVKLPSKKELDVKLRDIKAQGRLVSALEDVESGKAPLRTGFQRGEPSDEVRRLQRKVQDLMKENGITKESLDPDKVWKTALDGIKTRLKNQIKDLERQKETGEKTPKKQGVIYDEEARLLKEQRDALKSEIEFIEGKREISDEQKIKMTVLALERSIAEYERRINEGDINPKEKTGKTPETNEIKILRSIRDNVKEEYEQMKEDMNPKKTPEERALATLKTRLKNREAELQQRLDTGNFEKTPRRVTEPDEEAMKLKANVNRLKNKVDIEMKKADLANRSKFKKTLDFVATLRRTMLLTGVKVLGKLSSAAVQRTLISPIEEITGGLFSKLPGLSKIAKQAPREGGFNAKAEVKAISQWWQKATYQDMRDIIKSGKGTLDLIHGKEDIPPHISEFFGQLHQALKQPAKRNEYFRSFEKRMNNAAENGIDIMNPMVQATISTQAYIDANRAIFMQDNIATKAYKSFIASLERGGNLGNTSATALKIILPIVKVPTNYVAEVTSYAGGYAKALPLIGKAIFKGVDSLTPEQSDYVMRNLKKGSLGAAFIALGYFNAGAIGGYYQRGNKRDESDVKAGGLRLFGEDMPRWLVHTPLLECLQIGATLKRVQDTYEAKGQEGGGLASGLAVGKGLAEEIPFVKSPAEIYEASSSSKAATKYAKRLGESFVNPQFLQDVGLKIFDEKKSENTPLTKEERIKEREKQREELTKRRRERHKGAN